MHTETFHEICTTTRQFFEKIDKNEIKITEKDLFEQFKNLKPYVTDIEQIWYLCDKLEKYRNELLVSGIFDRYFYFKSSSNPNIRPEQWLKFFPRLQKLKTQIENNIFEQYCLPNNMENKAIELYEPLINRIFEMNNKKSTGESKNEVPIFTTNYDRVIDVLYEKRYESKGCIYIDGFDKPTIRSRRYYMNEDNIKNINKPIDEPIIRYIQLHGSIHWREKTKTSDDENLIIEKLPIATKQKTQTHDRPFIIYPGMIKTNDNFPFKQLYQCFEKYINDADLCIAIGCSCRDKNINDIFLKALESNPKLKLKIISGQNTVGRLMKASKNEFYGVKQYITNKRVIPINKRFGEFDPSTLL